MSVTSAIVAAAAAKRQRLIRHFMQARAFAPDSAIASESLPEADRLVKHLVDERVLVPAPGGTLYLDRSRLDRVMNAKRTVAAKRVLVAAAVAVALSLFAYYLASP